MNFVSTVKPIHRPIIPATPAKTGGAGTGNLNAANTTPHPKPVSIDNIISFMVYTFHFSIDRNALSINLLFLFLKMPKFFQTVLCSLLLRRLDSQRKANL